jgi:phage gp29-like protein
MATPSIQKPRVRVNARTGRPMNIERESLVIGGELAQSWLPAKNGGVYVISPDKLLNQKGFEVYREMRNDDQVKLTLNFKKVLVHGRAWEIKPASDSETDKDIAEFVEFNLRKNINLKKIIKEQLTALDYGFSLSEIVWEVTDYKGSRSLMIKDIKGKDPERLEAKLDKYGNILNWRQDEGTTPGAEEVTVPTSKVWYYAHQSEFGNPYGLSDLRAAYKSYWAKKFLTNFWNVFLERLGSPMMMMKYPQGSSEDLKQTLQNILKGLSTKTEVLVPEGVEVQLIEAMRSSGQATYHDALTYHNNAIARAILMVAMFGAGGDDVKRGADSQSRLHLRVLFKMADDLAQELIRTFEEQVIKQLVDYNFPNVEEYPKFVWQDYGEFEGIEVADTIRLLHAAGILDMDQNDVNYARSILGLPLRDEDDEEDEVVRPQPLPPPASSNAPPPSAGQGNELAKSSGKGGNDPARAEASKG